MTALSPAFQDHLDTGTTTLAWAWRITRSDGAIYGFTDHDADLIFDGTTFESETGLIASEIRQSADLAVDAQDAEGILTSDRINETDISDGLWDNADVEVWRVNWSNPAERALRRRGSIGQIRRGRVSFVAEVRSLTHILGQTVGRNFQGTCDAELGDARCGIDLELSIYKGTGEVATIRDDRTFTATGLGSYSTGWFSSGFVEWTSGANAGRRTEVAVHTNDVGGVAVVLSSDGDGRTARGAEVGWHTIDGASFWHQFGSATRWAFHAKSSSSLGAMVKPTATGVGSGVCFGVGYM